MDGWSRDDLPDAGLANCTATFLNLLGFEVRPATAGSPPALLALNAACPRSVQELPAQQLACLLLAQSAARAALTHPHPTGPRLLSANARHLS